MAYSHSVVPWHLPLQINNQTKSLPLGAGDGQDIPTPPSFHPGQVKILPCVYFFKMPVVDHKFPPCSSQPPVCCIDPRLPGLSLR